MKRLHFHVGVLSCLILLVLFAGVSKSLGDALNIYHETYKRNLEMFIMSKSSLVDEHCSLQRAFDLVVLKCDKSDPTLSFLNVDIHSKSVHDTVHKACESADKNWVMIPWCMSPSSHGFHFTLLFNFLNVFFAWRWYFVYINSVLLLLQACYFICRFTFINPWLAMERKMAEEKKEGLPRRDMESLSSLTGETPTQMLLNGNMGLRYRANASK